MAAIYRARSNCFGLGLTFWNRNHEMMCPYPEQTAALADPSVQPEAAPTVSSERALPAFNGPTYIPVQRAHKGSLVEVLELHNVTHTSQTQQDPECSIRCFYRCH